MRKPRTLSVEDDPSVRDWLKIVAGGSLDLHFAVTVADARKRLGQERWELLVFDVYLPDGKGTELLAALRSEDALALNRDTPVIMMTSSDDAEDFTDAWMDGSVAYVNKPCEVSEFSDAVSRALAQ